MTNPSKKYWEDRAAGRMVSYTAKAESTADTLGKAYYATARYLQVEANDVFNAFTDKFELSIAEAETMLKNAPNKSMFEQMKTALATCTDEQKKQQLETLLSSPAYAHRIGRLNDLDSKISDMCSRLANVEIGVDTEHLGDIIQNAYMQTVFDVTKGADYRAAFDLIPESRVKAILSTNWSGQMFSQRVWDNTNALADGLKHDMLVGIMAGKSEQHMADDIMNRCGVGAFEARRLVRTETTCVANMAELYGYKELDIDEYEFTACLDSRTSDLCRELDGKVFKRNSAQAGVNLPPMHPFCRSTTLPVLPSEEDLDKELAGLYDPKTRQIYTPNTDSHAKIDDAGLQSGDEGDIITEKRQKSGKGRGGNPYHAANGKFTNAPGGKTREKIKEIKVNDDGTVTTVSEVLPKTKYAPSPQINHKGIQVSQNRYGKLCSAFKERYPNATKGSKGVIYDDKYAYKAEADDKGGIIITHKRILK